MDNNNALVAFYDDDTPRADSREIANRLGIEHRSFIKMISEYEEEVSKDFGKVRFEITPSGKTNQPLKYALLTEDQSYVYLAYSQNTEQARTCKRLLVKAFSEARTRLAKPIYVLPVDLTSFIDQLRIEVYQKQEALDHFERGTRLLTGEVSNDFRDVTKSIKSPQSEIIRIIQKFQDEGKEAHTLRQLSQYIKNVDKNTIKATVASMVEAGTLQKEKTGKATRYSLPE